MKQEIKDSLYGAEQLQELLGMSRTQAWRVWNGHSKLTKRNEELLVMKLDIRKSARIKCEENADNWMSKKKASIQGGEVITYKVTSSESVLCKVVLINCKDTLGYISELQKMIDDAMYDSTRDVLTEAYFSELDSWVHLEKEFFIKDYK